MAIAQISPNSVQASPVNVNPQVKADQTATAYEMNQSSQKVIQAIKTDTVTISQQAIQKLSSDGDTNAKAINENVTDKVFEMIQGKA